MGMFDSLCEGDSEWQTKAYSCNLDIYRVGDQMPEILGSYYGPSDPAPTDYQVEVLGGHRRENRESLATVRGGVLASIDDPRDPALPLIDYGGHRTEGVPA